MSSCIQQQQTQTTTLSLPKWYMVKQMKMKHMHVRSALKQYIYKASVDKHNITA